MEEWKFLDEPTMKMIDPQLVPPQCMLHLKRSKNGENRAKVFNKRGKMGVLPPYSPRPRSNWWEKCKTHRVWPQGRPWYHVSSIPSSFWKCKSDLSTLNPPTGRTGWARMTTNMANWNYRLGEQIMFWNFHPIINPVDGRSKNRVKYRLVRRIGNRYLPQNLRWNLKESQLQLFTPFSWTVKVSSTLLWIQTCLMLLGL